MSTRISGYLPFLAMAIFAPAAAQAASPTCKGDAEMAETSREGRTTVVRSGSGHSANLKRTDGDGTIHLEQHGQNHAALAVQSGTGERLVIDQRGVGVEADVSQDGACNDTHLTQAGNGSRAVVSQSGGGNRVVVRQGLSKE